MRYIGDPLIAFRLQMVPSDTDGKDNTQDCTYCGCSRAKIKSQNHLSNTSSSQIASFVTNGLNDTHVLHQLCRLMGLYQERVATCP